VKAICTCRSANPQMPKDRTARNGLPARLSLAVEADRAEHYAENVDNASVALLGVLGGALASGLVQVIVAWFNRRSDSLAAARLAYGALVDAELELQAGVEARRFNPRGGETRLFRTQTATWQSQRDSLARVLNIVDFHLLQAAFFDLRHIDDVVEDAVRQEKLDGGLSLVLADPHHEGRVENLHQGQRITCRAGLRLRERLQLKKYEDRIADLQ
jgi:hypothetical protein